MPSLSETYGDPADDLERIVRLVLGIGALLAAGSLLALGLLSAVSGAGSAIGLPDGFAAAVGVTLALLAVPVTFGWIRVTYRADAGSIPFAVGLGLVALAVVSLWLAGPGLPTAGTVGFVVAAPYVVGVGLLLVGTLAGHRSRLTARTRRANRVTYRRTGAAGQRVLPADGGTDRDADLSFPTDDERRRD